MQIVADIFLLAFILLGLMLIIKFSEFTIKLLAKFLEMWKNFYQASQSFFYGLVGGLLLFFITIWVSYGFTGAMIGLFVALGVIFLLYVD